MADIQGIYNRLNSGSQYTPLSAETFGDWSMEAGDMVTVVKDGRSYLTPIMQGDLKWDGASKVTIESVGNREREPLGRMSRRKYSGGGGGYWNSKKAFTRIEDTGEAIELEAKARDDAITQTKGLIKVQADRISIVVDEKTGKIKAAEIVTEINNGTSGITLSANRINIDGLVTALASKTVTVNKLIAGTIQVPSPTGQTLFDVATVNYVNGSMYDIKVVSAGNNQYKLQRRYLGDNGDWEDVPNSTFSRATSLDGAWSSTYGPFRVQASPQGETMDIKVEFVAKGPSGFPIVRPAKTGANLFVIDLDVGSITGSGVNGKRTVSAKAGDNVAESAVLTDYGDGYRDGRNASTITPTAINVYTAQQGTLLSTKLSASILTAGKYITMKVGSTTYSIQIT